MTVTENARIECDEFLAAAPGLVWRALTDPELVARWWAPGDIRPVAGHRFTLDMGPWGRQDCQVLEADEPRLLRFTFGEGTLDTTLTWRLAPEGEGTRLFLTHEGFDLTSPAGRQARQGMGEGWTEVVRRIGPVAASLASPAVADRH